MLEEIDLHEEPEEPEEPGLLDGIDKKHFQRLTAYIVDAGLGLNVVLGAALYCNPEITQPNEKKHMTRKDGEWLPVTIASVAARINSYLEDDTYEPDDQTKEFLDKEIRSMVFRNQWKHLNDLETAAYAVLAADCMVSIEEWMCTYGSLDYSQAQPDIVNDTNILGSRCNKLEFVLSQFDPDRFRSLSSRFSCMNSVLQDVAKTSA